MSDYFKDNTDLYMTGNADEIVRKMDEEWWGDKRKKLTQLSGSLDTELIEFLPEDLRKKLLGREVSPEEFDEEYTDSFFLKVYQGKGGKKFKITCPTKMYNDTRKFKKKEHEECREAIYSLSSEPTGSLLSKPHRVKEYKKGYSKAILRFFSIPYTQSIPKVHSYSGLKYGKGDKRLIWIIDNGLKIVRLLYYGRKNNLIIRGVNT